MNALPLAALQLSQWHRTAPFVLPVKVTETLPHRQVDLRVVISAGEVVDEDMLMTDEKRGSAN